MSAVLERPALFGPRPPVPPRRNVGLAHGPMDDDNEPDYPADPAVDSPAEWVPLFSAVSPMILSAIDQIGSKYLTPKQPPILPMPPTPALVALWDATKDLPEDQI